MTLRPPPGMAWGGGVGYRSPWGAQDPHLGQLAQQGAVLETEIILLALELPLQHPRLPQQRLHLLGEDPTTGTLWLGPPELPPGRPSPPANPLWTPQRPLIS